MTETLPSEAEEFFAHTLPDHSSEHWQKLSDHLTGVADRASKFAAPFGAEEWAKVAGLWHDLGKYSPAFQSYLRTASQADSHVADSLPRTDHSTAGAQHAVSSFNLLGHLLAYPIAGHHSGLLDAIDNGASLELRLKKLVEPWTTAPSSITEQPRPDLPLFVKETLGRKDAFGISLFVRMLFSCLVDADFLDTEAFMNPEGARERPNWPDDMLTRMCKAVEEYIAQFQPEPTEVNRQRALVLNACLRAAEHKPGFFSLTVPTGGGKTLSSLSFALSHALQHGLDRIIYVVPFTSIIEQNADVFRKVFAPLVESGIHDPVIEHHSNLDPDNESISSRLASENWDAPLVVTTSVQFYESLFANRTSRCRKLHNLARSVIILDEAQSIPVDFLEPCLKALDELQRNYGATIVLCTATQPAIHRREDFRIGLELDEKNEIVPDRKDLYTALKRVTVERAGSLSDEQIVSLLMEEERVLCIVNTRRHALRLSQLLGEEEGHIHLSALMCPEHRSDRISQIRDRMKNGERCRVISTNLIEAGVDLDFPVVYRAMTGIDSIAQAAGRCNRNGLLPMGRTIIFEPEDVSGERFLSDMVGSARQVLSLYDDPLSLEAIEHYFRLHYWDREKRWDSKDILQSFHLDQDSRLPFLFGFSSAAHRFRLIEDSGRSIIIPWGEEGEALCKELREAWPSPSVKLRRKLQRYTVTIPQHLWNTHRDRAFEILHDQYPVLNFPHTHYSNWTGLRLDLDPTASFVQ